MYIIFINIYRHIHETRKFASFTCTQYLSHEDLLKFLVKGFVLNFHHFASNLWLKVDEGGTGHLSWEKFTQVASRLKRFVMMEAN